MNFEENRLQTFHNWPANAAVEPQRVAKAGFFYTGVGLVVECFSCGGRISEWDYGDQVMAKHRLLNPDCPFVRKPNESGNIPILNSSVSNVSVFRSGSTHCSASSQSDSARSLIGVSSEGNNSISNVGRNESVHIGLLQQESADNRNGFTSPGITGGLGRMGDSERSSQSSREEGSVQENIPDIRIELDSQYRSEAARLETFRTWPKSEIISPELLAKAGFFYLQEGEGDTVMCAFCSGLLGHWETGDDPIQEHRRHFPACPLHYNIPVGNIPLNAHISGMQQYGSVSSNVMVREVHPVSTTDGEERRTMVEHSKSLPEGSNVFVEGIQQHQGPRHPKYSTVESRLRSFKDWSSSLRQTPLQLAQAGFFYTGMNDQVRCFHCDGGLRQWDDSDDPWVEHARWFPKCIFVILMKGEEFIQQVASQHPPVLPTDNSHSRDNSQTTTTNPTPYKVRNVSEEELNGLMNTIPAKMAVEVGLDVSKIRCALKDKVEQTGLPYTTSDALIGAVLDMSSNSSSSHSPESPTPGASQEFRDQAGVVIEQNVPETSSRDEDRQELQKEEQCASSKTLTTSQSVPSLSQASAAEPNVYFLEQTNIQPVPSTRTENSEDSSAALLAEENRRLKEARLCKICMDEEVGVVFLPCGHLVTCVYCTPSLQDCPLCRQPIKATVRTFFS